jgi:hypothetical protein
MKKLLFTLAVSAAAILCSPAQSIQQSVAAARSYGHHEPDSFEAILARNDTAFTSALIQNDTAFTNSLIRSNDASTAETNFRLAQEKAQLRAQEQEAARQRYEAARERDQAAKANSLDDDLTIKEFLELNGYKNVGSIQIDKVRAYLSNHGLKHVSEIGQ